MTISSYSRPSSSGPPQTGRAGRMDERDADCAHDQAKPASLRSKDVLDTSAHPGAGGVAASDVRRHRSTGVIVDVTMLDVMDSFAVRTLRGIAQMVKLLGAECVVVGMQPDVAFTMVQLGLTLEGTKMAIDLEDGLELLSTRKDREMPDHD